LLTSLQDANLDRRRGELTRSAHPDAPHLARRGEPTPNTLSVVETVAAANESVDFYFCGHFSALCASFFSLFFS